MNEYLGVIYVVGLIANHRDLVFWKIYYTIFKIRSIQYSLHCMQTNVLGPPAHVYSAALFGF